jgi:hypothetical protein
VGKVALKNNADKRWAMRLFKKVTPKKRQLLEKK